MKLAGLTVATHVYRGVAGMRMPKSFFEKNAMNIAGGIEYGFSSTTTERKTAAFYAKSEKASTIMEAQQGMVDRGADVGFLSQFPGEGEIVYNPLVGMEVRGTRIEGTTLIIGVHMSVNQKSATLEQVISKRRKVVSDMKDQMRSGFDLELPKWNALRVLDPGMLRTNGFLRLFDQVAERDASYYNDDEQLGSSVLDAVALSKMLEGWLEGLPALVERQQVANIAALQPGEDGIFKLAGNQPVSQAQAWGIIALGWSCGHTLSTLDLTGSELSPESLVDIARALPPTLSKLVLSRCNVARRGKDVQGIAQLAQALRSPECQLKELDLDGNHLMGELIALISSALEFNGSVTCVDVRKNNIAGDGASELSAAVLANTKIEVFNEIPIKEMRADSLTELDLQRKGIGVESSMVVAGLLPAMGSMTKISLAANKLEEEGTRAICEALKANRTLKELDVSGSVITGSNIGGAAGAKHVADMLSVNVSVTKINLFGNSIGAEGAKAIADALLVNGTVTKISLAYNNLDDHAKKLLRDANRKRSKPAVLEL